VPICWCGSNVLLELARCGVCRRTATPDAEELALMRWLDEQCLATPFYGSRMAAVRRLTARQVNWKRGGAADEGDELEALRPKPEDQPPLGAAPDLPLPVGRPCDRPNQGAADITYIRMAHGCRHMQDPTPAAPPRDKLFDHIENFIESDWLPWEAVMTVDCVPSSADVSACAVTMLSPDIAKKLVLLVVNVPAN
jgi:hypothetical protein